MRSRLALSTKSFSSLLSLNMDEAGLFQAPSGRSCSPSGSSCSMCLKFSIVLGVFSVVRTPFETITVSILIFIYFGMGRVIGLAGGV